MSATIRTETITSHEGETFSAHLAVPATGSGPGIVLFHEIMGVNQYIKVVAERLTGLGYVVLAPDMFWRIDPDHPIEREDDNALEQAFARIGDFDWQQGFRDGDAALAHIDRLDETTGSVGVLGFCMGGTLAYGVAVQSEPDAAVAYYGSGIGDMLDVADKIHCPILFHYGADDPFIAADQVDAVQQTFAERDDAFVHVYPSAGHAFDNEYADEMFSPVAAKEAWGVTADFLRQYLGA